MKPGIDRMALVYTVLIILAVVVVCALDAHCQEIVVYEFKSPGAGGMVSNYDLDLLNPTQSPYLFNADVTSKPGVIRRRAALVDYGTNTTKLYGAFGYYNPLTGHKQVIGVTDHATYDIGQLVVSDTFGTEVGYDTIGGNLFPYADAYHDWTPYKHFNIHADGKTIPGIYTTTEGFKDSVAFPDTTGFSPHVISMGLEAPGQPRAFVSTATGGQNGKYRYAFAYGSKAEHGPLSIQSAQVVSDGGAIYITNWPHSPDSGSLDTVSLFRRKEDGKQQWLFVDTIIHFNDSHRVYIDTFSDTLSTVHDSTVAHQRPGRIGSQHWLWLTYAAPPVPDADTISHYAWPDTLYRYAYSLFDPVTGIESPLGPYFETTAVWVDTNTPPAPDSAVYYLHRLDLGHIDTLQNPKWVRFYQTIKQTNQAGGGDTAVWRCLFQFRAADRYVVVGQWDDVDIVAGLDSSYITEDTIYSYELPRNDVGGVIVLPPYFYDCQIPFSDIEYLAGRFWGIGDPDNKSWVYYSEYDAPTMNIFSWYPLDYINFLEIGNDELVAIERAEGFGDDAMYVFAHNSVWLMSVYGDYQAISTRIGAASREVVVKHGEIVYFVSPNLRTYALSGPNLQEISQPIENYIDTVLISFDYASNYRDFYAFGHAFGDYVRWFNDSTGLGLSFNTKPEAGTWSLVKHSDGAYAPRGSFTYDTLRSGSFSVGLTNDLYMVFADSAVSLRYASETQNKDDGSGSLWDRVIEFYYETPPMGDQVNNWQVQRMGIRVDPQSTSYLRYVIYNENGDSLCGDSAYFPADSIQYKILDVPYNLSSMPMVRFSALPVDSVWDSSPGAWLPLYNNYDLMSVRVWLQNMGLDNVE